MNKNQTFQTFLKYVSLNVLGMVGLSCYILADTFFVSNALGTKGLAALNFSISIYSIIHGAGLMIGLGGATRYTILKVQDKSQKANENFSQSLKVGLIIGLLFVFVGLFLNRPLAEVLGARGETLPLTRVYLTTILCFAPCFITNNVLLAFIRNDNNPKLAMAAMVIGSLSNVVLDYIFVFPLSMGMFGAALATGIAPIISIGILSIHFLKNHQLIYLPGKIRIKSVLINMNLGLSAFITEISSGIVLIVFNLVILRLEGNTGVAAYGVVANLSLVAIAIFTGIAQGIQPLVSQGQGRKDNLFLKQVFWYAKVTAVFLAVLIYIVTACNADNIIALFNREQDESLQALATTGFHIYFIGFLFAGINVITAAFLSATEKAKSAFLISSMRGCLVIIPAVMILSRLCGMNGVWWSFVITECLVAITAYWIQRKGREKIHQKAR